MTTEDSARRRIGAGIRALGHRVIGTTASLDVLTSVADDIERLVERVIGTDRRRSAERPRDHFTAPANGARFADNPDRPFSGSASPLGCDLDIRRDDNEVVATAVLRAAHEGPPGRSHGGVVAAIFDDIFGLVLQIEETAAFTGELAIRYETGTPLHRPVVFRARLANRVGRKLFMTADAWDGEQRLATATATFITPAGEWPMG